MRPFSPEFAAHIASGATTLCNCWRITKTNDEALGFTDHDKKLTFDGTVFIPAGGMTPSTVVQQAKTAIDTSEIVGWLDDERIVSAHIKDGQFAGARVEHFKVNWRDLEVRHHFRTDFIGEITEKDGVFTAELRSQHIKLNQNYSRLYQRRCNAAFGDKACGIDVAAPENSAICTIADTGDGKAILVDGLSSRPGGWATGGYAIWLDGERKNKKLIISSHEKNGEDHVLYLSEPDHGLATTGDQLRVIIGCDKRFSTCRERFSNHLNFQGFPHIPGENFVLSYPTNNDKLDGSILVK